MYQFEIPGAPIPQQQMQFNLNRNPPQPYNPCRKDIERIKWLVKPTAPRAPVQGPVSLELYFFMPIPKATPKARRRQMQDRLILPIGRPDEDNLSYLVTNALKGIVYADDSQICKKLVYKFYSDEPRTCVVVRRIETGIGQYWEDQSCESNI